jgi:hypothetical protein
VLHTKSTYGLLVTKISVQVWSSVIPSHTPVFPECYVRSVNLGVRDFYLAWIT